MVTHIFALRWTAEATAEQKARALDQIRAFPQHIPEIEGLQAGTNISARAQGYETIGILHFADRAALNTYLYHPAHEAFVRSVQPFIEAIDLDLET